MITKPKLDFVGKSLATGFILHADGLRTAPTTNNGNRRGRSRTTLNRTKHITKPGEEKLEMGKMKGTI